MKMKKRVSIILILSMLIILFTSNKFDVAEAYEVNSAAKAMVVLEGNTNTVLYSKNANQELAMASTTKIVTAILAIENCKDLDEKFLVSEKAIGIEGTSIYLKSGERLSMRELQIGRAHV